MHVRRIVTGHDAAGRSVIVADGPAPRHADFQDLPGHGIAQLWCSEPGASLDGDPTGPRGSLIPGPGGTSLLLVNLPPDSVMGAPHDPERALAEMVQALPGLLDCFEPDAPGMHRTPTLDYGILLEGELWLELEAGDARRLSPGDVVIQQGTRHAWRNRSTGVARMAFFMIGLPRAQASVDGACEERCA